jgi:hypothetical protein
MPHNRGDLLRLHVAIEGLKGEAHANWSRRFKYALGVNRRRIQPVIDAYREAMTGADAARQAFEDARMKLVTTNADMDENGTIRTNAGADGSTQAIVRDQGVFEMAMRALMLDWQPRLDAAARDQARQARELEREDEPIELHMVDFDEVPADLPLAAMDALIPMIIDGKAASPAAAEEPAAA